MNRFPSVVTAVVTLSLASTSTAATLFDSAGFESYTLGSVVGQHNWSLNGGNSSQHVIQTSVTLGTKALRLDGSTKSWAYPAINYTPLSNEIISINADFAASDVNTTAIDNGGFAINLTSLTGTQIGRFGLRTTGNLIRSFVFAPYNVATSLFDPAAVATNVLLSSGLDAATFYNFEARVNFTTKTYDLYTDGHAFVTNVPFVTPTATGLGHADSEVLGVSGATNSGYLDNLKVSAIPIPEPTAAGILAIGSLAMTRRRRA